jgi:hypothetical protein
MKTDQSTEQIKKALLQHLRRVNNNPELLFRHPEFRKSIRGEWEILTYILQKGTPSEKGFYQEAHKVQGRDILHIRAENALIVELDKKYAYSQNGWEYYWVR